MDVNKHNFHECCCLYIFPLIRRQNSNYQCLKKPNLHCLSVSLTFSKATVREVREEFNNANNQRYCKRVIKRFIKIILRKIDPVVGFLVILCLIVCALDNTLFEGLTIRAKLMTTSFTAIVLPLAYSSYFLERDDSSDFRAATLFAIWILFISVSMLQRLM